MGWWSLDEGLHGSAVSNVAALIAAFLGCGASRGVVVVILSGPPPVEATEPQSRSGGLDLIVAGVATGWAWWHRFFMVARNVGEGGH